MADPVSPDPKASRPAWVSDHFWAGTGTALARVLSFLAVTIIGRLLGPEEFGRFSLAFYVMAMLGQLSSAIDEAVVKRIGTQPDQDREIISAALVLKLAFHLGMLVVGIVLAHPVLTLGLRKENFFVLYALALAGSSATALYNLLLARTQARRQFVAYAAWSVGVSAALLAGVAAVNFLAPATVALNLIVFIAVTAVAVIVWLLRSGPWPGWERARAHLPPLWHFGAWLGVSTLAAAVHQRLDVFVLSSFTDFAQVGQYSAAVRISMVTELINRTITVALFPRAMAVHEPGQLRGFFRDAKWPLALALGSGAATLLLAGPLLHLFFGARFQDALWPAQVLCAANLALLAYTPLSWVFYILNRPQLIAALGVMKLIAAAAIALVLVPRMGARGAALTMLLTNLLALIFVIFWAKKLFAKSPWTSPPPSPG